MANNHIALLRNEEGRRLVRSKCKEMRLDFSVLEQLITVELEHQGKRIKRGITESLNDVFDSIEAETG